jgi:ribosomal protein S18 acetylase RimI-like enzyme
MRVTVSPAAPDGRTAACRALCAHLPAPARDLAAVRYLDLLAAGEFDPAGLFAAHDADGVLRGAMLVQPLPGALGLAWPPRAEGGRDRAAVEDALVRAACGWLRGRGVKVCQSFAAPADRPDMTGLERHGFRLLTQVTHLRREIDPAGHLPEPGEPALAFARTEADPFAATLLATHDGSRDCPELTGTRAPAELLDGFRPPPHMPPGWRYLVRHGADPVGVVLLDPGTEPAALELAYLGLVPAARGRGWGDRLVRFAVGVAAAEQARALTLSVDVRNAPAGRLYARHGFREYDRRDVYLAAWPG